MAHVSDTGMAMSNASLRNSLGNYYQNVKSRDQTTWILWQCLCSQFCYDHNLFPSKYTIYRSDWVYVNKARSSDVLTAIATSLGSCNCRYDLELCSECMGWDPHCWWHKHAYWQSLLFTGNQTRSHFSIFSPSWKHSWHNINIVIATSTQYSGYQNKVLRCFVNVPWYAHNSDIHQDLGVETVASIIARYPISHENRLQHHVNEEASASRLLNVQHLIRRLKRTKPFGFAKQFDNWGIQWENLAPHHVNVFVLN
jgi:hypothetical protein